MSTLVELAHRDPSHIELRPHMSPTEILNDVAVASCVASEDERIKDFAGAKYHSERTDVWGWVAERYAAPPATLRNASESQLRAQAVLCLERYLQCRIADNEAGLREVAEGMQTALLEALEQDPEAMRILLAAYEQAA